MNGNVKRLYQIAQKPQRTIIGLMSGTSLDGLDIALCTIEGVGTQMRLILDRFITVPYMDDFKKSVSSVFSQRQVDLEQVCLLNAWIGREHARMILACLRSWRIEPKTVDIIASHGQTIFHAPRILHNKPGFPNATLQIGDGDHIAVGTGIITVSDFRQKHLAAGGEGAPLAAYGDYLLFSKAHENRILLNIGGIANFTYLPGSLDGKSVFSTDTGPGNTLMDAFVREYYGQYFDENGALAASGNVNKELLHCLKDAPFFNKPFPKTTGPELFNLAYLDRAKQVSGTDSISDADTMATLNMFSADTIAEAVLRATKQSDGFHFYVSGGGIHNSVLLDNISKRLPDTVFTTTAELGIHPDAKEAVLFAVLANEAVSGGDTQFGGVEGAMPTVSMGKISFPY